MSTFDDVALNSARFLEQFTWTALRESHEVSPSMLKVPNHDMTSKNRDAFLQDVLKYRFDPLAVRFMRLQITSTTAQRSLLKALEAEAFVRLGYVYDERGRHTLIQLLAPSFNLLKVPAQKTSGSASIQHDYYSIRIRDSYKTMGFGPTFACVTLSTAREANAGGPI